MTDPNICPFCNREPVPAIPGPMAVVGNEPPFEVLICQTCGEMIADFFGRARERRRAERAEAELARLKGEK